MSGDRLASYRVLVGKRKTCSVCNGLTNPSACAGGSYDSDHIGPWTLWQERVDMKKIPKSANLVSAPAITRLSDQGKDLLASLKDKAACLRPNQRVPLMRSAKVRRSLGSTSDTAQ